MGEFTESYCIKVNNIVLFRFTKREIGIMEGFKGLLLL